MIDLSSVQFDILSRIWDRLPQGRCHSVTGPLSFRASEGVLPRRIRSLGLGNVLVVSRSLWLWD